MAREQRDYLVIKACKFDGEKKKPGDKLRLDADAAAIMRAAGKIGDPKSAADKAIAKQAEERDETTRAEALAERAALKAWRDRVIGGGDPAAVAPSPKVIADAVAVELGRLAEAGAITINAPAEGGAPAG